MLAFQASRKQRISVNGSAVGLLRRKIDLMVSYIMYIQ